MNSRLKTAVIGVGYLGRFHAQKHAALNKDIELIGVCDAFLDQAKKVGEELKVAHFTDPKGLLGKVDAITIASTTSSHFELAKTFLENGVHVLVEKPITAKSVEAKELIEIAKKKKVCLQVGHIERFSPPFLKGAALVQKPELIVASRLAPFKPRALDVDVVRDLMIHDVDLVLKLVKSEVVSIEATGISAITPTWDTVTAVLKFKNGCKAILNASRLAITATRHLTIHEEGRIVDMDLGNLKLFVRETPDKKKLSVSQSGQSEGLTLQETSFEKVDALLDETKSFIEAIKSSRPPVVTGEDGYHALEVVERIVGKL